MANQNLLGFVTDHPLAYTAVVVAAFGVIYAVSRPSVPPVGSQTEASRLSGQVRSWSCPTPSGADGIRPLFNIRPDADALLTEARARIELERQRTGSSWEIAASGFALSEQSFATSYHYLSEYKRRALLFITNEPSRAPELVNSFELQYSQDCAAVRDTLSRRAVDSAGLKALMTKPGGRWRNGQLPCLVSRVANCKA